MQTAFGVDSGWHCHFGLNIVIVLITLKSIPERLRFRGGSKNEVTGPSVGFKTFTSNRTNPDDSFVCLNSSTAAAAHTRVFVISLTVCLTYSFNTTSGHILPWCLLCMMPWVLQHYLME